MRNIDPSMSRRNRKGFTLLELVVVIGILAILTGLLLPKFDVFKLKANKAVAASNMTDITRLIQTFYVQNAVYPNKWDSLVTGGGALWEAADAAALGLEPQLTGAPGVGNPTKLKTIILTDDGDLRSLQRIGINTVLDLAGGTIEEKPNDHFTVDRLIASGGTFATLNTTNADPGDPLAIPPVPPTPASGDEDALAIVEHIYPTLGGNTPDGKKLIVLGFGTRLDIGNLVMEVPTYPNTDITKYYSRFLAVFEIGGGSRAELKAVLGADGDPIFDEMADFYER